MAWTFFSDTGAILNPAGTRVGSGYAGGNKGQNPEGVNNPAMESIKDIGPLPRGGYTIASPEDNPVVGQFAMALTPDAENLMFGRDSFFLHGDNQQMNESASEGCLVAARYIRTLIADSEDKTLLVTSN